jgi:1-acyl-sn-glycerol-3-phosphate acyltransferase
VTAIDAPGPPQPSAEELAGLTATERRAFRFTHRMNQGRAKRVWTWCQRAIGARAIRGVTSRLVRVYGLEHVRALSPGRAVLLVANHRSFFDMFVVSSILMPLPWWRRSLYFPVRGRYCYRSVRGMLLNFAAGWWSAYPPFFGTPATRAFDLYSLRLLTGLCRDGAGRAIGFHPEGTRNQGDDPYTFLPAQPGVGRLIMEGNPQVIPVFIAGLGNRAARQILANWRGGEPIRIHFGPILDLSAYLERPRRMRSYKEIADEVMRRIAELGEGDRAMMSAPHPSATTSAATGPTEVAAR